MAKSGIEIDVENLCSGRIQYIILFVLKTQETKKLSKIKEHSTDIKDVHLKLIKDFANLQDIAKKALDSLENTHEHISEEHLKNTNYIEEAIEQLKEANEIVTEMFYTLMDIPKNVDKPDLAD